MLFNSLQFAVFFIMVYCLYLALSHRWRNKMLLVASYVFYGAWDWRFLSLIWISTGIDYFCALGMAASPDQDKKKRFLYLSIFGNLSILGFFKYFNFFSANLQTLIGLFGFSVQPHLLQVILPAGISFYTFQTMGYTIEVFRGGVQPTRRFFDYALYVAFFPLLLAGPIERAGRLLPQILVPRALSLRTFYEGCYLIFWGLFQKMFIADNLARIVDPVYSSGPPYRGEQVLLATGAFSFQLLADFAGYSDIARGMGKCLGFDIMVNFNLPYFATTVTEFWRRWHISLSTWFRDYVYSPLALQTRAWGTGGILFSLGVTFTLIGFWHGAEWKYIIFGFAHGAVMIGELLTRKKRKRLSQKLSPLLTGALGMLATFGFLNLTLILFRAKDISHALALMRAIAEQLSFVGGTLAVIWDVLFFTAPLLIIQYLQYRKNDLLVVLTLPVWVRGLIYFGMYFLLVAYGVEGGREFIYFQF